MRKKNANLARLVREIGAILVLALQVVKLIIEIANKVANCDARKLQIQVPSTRQVHLCS